MVGKKPKYYPILFVDCVHIKIHRKRSVASEAFYVALAVTEEGTREVLGIFNMPIESATGWKEIFGKLKETLPSTHDALLKEIIPVRIVD